MAARWGDARYDSCPPILRLARFLDRLRQLVDGRRHRPAHRLRQRAHLLHQLLEVGRCEGLRAIGEGLVRVRVNLDDQAVDAGGDGGQRDGRDQVPLACGVAGVADDRQMAQPLDHRYCVHVEGEAGGRLVGADAALAEDDVGVAVGEDVRGGEQPLLDRRPHAALEEHGLVRLADLVQEGEVLHVAAANLEDVGVAGDEVDVAGVHHLGDDGQAGLGAGFGEDLEALFAVTTEGVGATAGLEGAAAQDMGAGGLHRPRRLHDVLLRVHRTGTRHHHQAAVADLQRPHLHDRVLLLHLAAGELEGLADADDGVDAVKDGELVEQLRVDGAEHGDDVALNAADQVVLEPQLSDVLLDGQYLGFGGLCLHYDDHLGGLLFSGGGAFRSRLALPQAGPAALQSGPQDPGAVEIDVDDIAGSLLGVHVGEDGKKEGEGARYVHLVSAEEGHVSPAHLPGGESREFGVEVGAGCEEGGGHVFDVCPVRLHHRSQELGGGGQDRLAGVALDGGGAADASSQHDDIAEARPATAGAGP